MTEFTPGFDLRGKVVPLTGVAALGGGPPMTCERRCPLRKYDRQSQQ